MKALDHKRALFTDPPRDLKITDTKVNAQWQLFTIVHNIEKIAHRAM